MRHLLCLLLVALALPVWAQTDGNSKKTEKETTYTRFRYRVSFTDKNKCGFSIDHPERFLSPKSLARRARYGLAVDEHDLPLTPAYLKQLRKMGLPVVTQSKWNNTAVVELRDTSRLAAVRALPFVKGVRCVWMGTDEATPADTTDRAADMAAHADSLTTYYGFADGQVKMLGVDRLHAAGYRGSGVTIAVIDGGFHNADIIPGLKGVKVLGTRNFVRPGKSVYEEQSHGMMVLSCIAAHTPRSLVGTAPEASFYLLQSEDGSSEQQIEEDYWAAAIEYADSLGCDLVTSSLGYTQFDHKEMNHHYWELDGRTALISRSASLAASRGILLLNSAGNSGNDQWKKIGVPADACDMLAVGAVTPDSLNTNFSSLGYSADGRIKPDVMAQGLAAAVYSIHGKINWVNGTSFSCPIMCGAAACLVQRFPNKRPTEIIRALQQSGDNVAHPDNVFGYGIPNVMRAAEILERP